MSITVYSYVVLGQKFDYNTFMEKWEGDDSIYDLECQDVGDNGIILDGISGEYVVAGKILYENTEYGEEGFAEIDYEEKDKTEIEEFLKTECKVFTPDIKLIVFNHFS